jgi:hypothetical protein
MNFRQKFEPALIIDSGAWAKLIHDKKLEAKISWQCLFKDLKNRK